jgi:hypothetical protein
VPRRKCYFLVRTEKFKFFALYDHTLPEPIRLVQTDCRYMLTRFVKNRSVIPHSFAPPANSLTFESPAARQASFGSKEGPTPGPCTQGVFFTKPL